MLIEELFPKDMQIASLPFAVRFFCCFTFLANGSYQKCIANNIYAPLSQSSASRAIKYICNLIVKHKSSEVTFPITNEEQLAIKATFYTKFGLKGGVGAIDCTHVALICPPKNDTTKPCSLYMNRKGYYSVNVEAVCDDKLRFLAINANFPGSCHDSGLWTTSKPWLITPLAEPASLQEPRGCDYNSKHLLYFTQYDGEIVAK
ncbi:putative nuclease HARBI1 isoform X2 [Rhagoletis pomonella]|uniref:putative nuclease HARBI1 isoform X2 n=1 Tax=Rhagoletis pomonella TaxID=28610 RepID=UPI001781EB94|nr:putative nuclease HARBI1 isoform X2 [Rhagoletis pomonella]